MHLKCHVCGYEENVRTREQAFKLGWGASPSWTCPECSQKKWQAYLDKVEKGEAWYPDF